MIFSKKFASLFLFNRKIASQLEMFWKEASLMELSLTAMDGSEDIFGIEIDSKINRAKFTFDTMVRSLFFFRSLCVFLRNNQMKTYRLFGLLFR